MAGQAGLLNALQSELAQALVERDMLSTYADEGDQRMLQANRRIDAIGARIEAERALLVQARTDSLTGLHNARHLREESGAVEERAAHSSEPLSAVMIDVDNFKRYNDAHGHPAGVLVRMSCYYARYAGQLQAAAEIEEIVWLSYRHRPKVSAVDQLIFDWLRQQGLLAE